ncbi:glycolate oxidase subunit GlcD [Tepidibacillus infernus]|uniref:glycolate oxidase subunit GlcD n=1 Tax=Tepidibacillus TaxID=1494427 RepID=UPI000852BF09|nr:glycolate oxidase subunit GlcD [Tepidibacillus sp. HK-1]GBF12490.1 putative FAD-linked oxidoreductase [Tepidibacillus sp. HK-1]
MLDPAIKKQLIDVVGKDWVMDQPEELVAYSYDSTPMYQQLPDVVVLPKTTEEVSAILKIANHFAFPVIPRGSATNLSGGTVPLKGGLVLGLNRMNQILEIDEENLTCTVQPGVITAEIHQAVEARGLFYPPDPGSLRISTIGGNIAENAGGLRGLKYGVTKDYVIALTAVLPNGDILKTGGKLAKDVAGYDLTKLLIGSEGTLAVITEATLKLLPLPETKRTMLAMFKDLTDAAKAVSKIIANKIIPVTLEFMDNATINVVEDYVKIGLPRDVEAILLMEQDGSKDQVDRDITRMAEICKGERAVSVEVAQTTEEANQLMTARRMALSALARLKPTTILEDATVPRSEIAPLVDKIKEVAQKYDLHICTFGHAGDGNLHPTCLTDVRNTDEIERVEKAFDEIYEKTIDLGGTITGEHGVGIAKASYLEWKIGESGVEVMKGIKKAFDPKGILNPGKLFVEQARKRVVIQHER